MSDLAQLIQALGAPMVVLLIWLHWNRTQRKNGNSGTALLADLREAQKEHVKELRAQTAALQGIMTQITLHDAGAKVTRGEVHETLTIVGGLYADMAARQRRGE